MASEKTDILISGAGPAGLMMACQLALHQVSFRIIEKKEKQPFYSGALIIQPRTMEIFDQMGIANKILDYGIIAHTLSIQFNGKTKSSMTINHFGEDISPYPYLVLIEQTKTMRILEEFISEQGYTVEHGTELVDFTNEQNQFASSIRTKDQHIKQLNSRYLIAADGSNSFIRNQIGIPFAGKSYKGNLFIIDCKATVNQMSDEISIAFSNRTVTGLFPLSHGRWRIDGIVHNGRNKEELDFAKISAQFQRRSRLKLMLHEPEWFSIFHIHQRHASIIQHNGCFLVGDAAHVHTPVGAQGMNTAIQDAYNLAWKLAYVIHGRAWEGLLDTYSYERFKVSEKVTAMADKIFKLISKKHFKLFWLTAARICAQAFIIALDRRSGLRVKFFEALSQTGIHYRNSPISQHASMGMFPPRTPEPGDRVPYVLFFRHNKIINIQDLIKGTYFHLFVFTKKVPPELIQLTDKHQVVIDFLEPGQDTKQLFKTFGIKREGMYLIRPDMYIAFRSSRIITKDIQNYLDKFLKVQVNTQLTENHFAYD